MCHVHQVTTHPGADSFQLAGKTDIFMITHPPVPARMSDFLPPCTLFILTWTWTNQMFLGDKGGGLYDEWGRVRWRVEAQQQCLCIFSLRARLQLGLLDVLDVTWPPEQTVAWPWRAAGERRRRPAPCLSELIKTSDLRRPFLTPAFVVLLSLPLLLSVYFKPCSLSPSSFLRAFLELCPLALSSMLSYSM